MEYKNLGEAEFSAHWNQHDMSQNRLTGSQKLVMISRRLKLKIAIYEGHLESNAHSSI